MKILGQFDFHSLIVLNIVNTESTRIIYTSFNGDPPIANVLLEATKQAAADTPLLFSMSPTTVAGSPSGFHILIPREQEQFWNTAAETLPNNMDISHSTPAAGFYGGLHSPKSELVVGETGYYWIEID